MSDTVKQKCKTCGGTYDANKVIKEDGTILITPPRCPECQTNYLTNIRVNKVLKDLSLIANLRQRLTPEKRQRILDAIAEKLTETANRFAGTATVESSFDISRK